MHVHGVPGANHKSLTRTILRSYFRSLGSAAVCLLAVLLCGIADFVQAATLPFYIGGDISSTSFIQQQVAAASGQFTDSGVAAPLDQIMYDHGANLFRLRIFVNPNTSWNATAGAIQDTTYDIALAQQIKTNDPGAKIVLDFHYSDTWADPGHQTIPSAWTGQSLTTMENSLQSYTYNTLNSFYTAGVMPDIVQLGNETTSGMLWPTGQLNFNGTLTQQNASWAAYGGLLNAGIAGVRQIQSQYGMSRIPVALSIDKGDKDGQPQYHYGMLQKQVINGGTGVGGGGVTDFDIEGVDFYSSSNSGITTMKNNLTTLANTNIAAFNAAGNVLPQKRIMVLETNWPNGSGSSGYTGTWAKTPAGQEQELLDVRNMLLGLPQNDGAGVLWWYPESVRVSGYTGYQNGVTALFDNTINHAAEPAINDATQNPFAPIRGDFNGDGHFNAADIAAMESALSDLSSYQTARSFTNPDMNYLGDFNGDGVINIADLQGMINSLLAGGGSSEPVPEPSTGLLLAAAAIILVFHSRHRRITKLSLRSL
jgi:arabinogalactan endo-1,4-beta-galactosidase